MQPYYEDAKSGIVLYCGDVLELFSGLPRGDLYECVACGAKYSDENHHCDPKRISRRDAARASSDRVDPPQNRTFAGRLHEASLMCRMYEYGKRAWE